MLDHSRVASDSLDASQVRGVWDCAPPDNHLNGATLQTVATLCTGLDKAVDFWKWGHDGHYPLKERITEDKVKVNRYICTLQNQQLGGPHAVAVMQPEPQELPLICLHTGLRGAPGEAVNLLNKILGTLAGKQVSWISSNDPNTINFYKSLHIDCACDNLGNTQKEVKGMIFKGKAPVVKKVTYYYIDNNEVKRIYPNLCMSADDFSQLMNDLTQRSNDVRAALPNIQQPLWSNAPMETVLLSNLVNQVRINKLQKQTDYNAFIKLNPISC